MHIYVYKYVYENALWELFKHRFLSNPILPFLCLFTKKANISLMTFHMTVKLNMCSTVNASNFNEVRTKEASMIKLMNMQAMTTALWLLLANSDSF